MIKVKRPVLFDCRVAALENCFPMIPSGKAHNEMLLPEQANDEATATAFAGGKAHNEMLLPEEATDEATAKAFAGGKALV